MHNGIENDSYHPSQSNNNAEEIRENPRSCVTQTLQQITGSPGRARDRNVFNTSATSTAAVQLPLLRGFSNFFITLHFFSLNYNFVI